MSLKPNPGCDDYRCRRQQATYQEYLATNPKQVVEEEEDESVVHDENAWGISLVDETDPDLLKKDDLSVATGIRVAYTIPERSLKERSEDEKVDEVGDEVSLDDLMGQMKRL